MISHNIDDIVSVNKLWGRIYPYLSLYIRDLYGKNEGSVLEYGIFSGGISIGLARLSKEYQISIGGLESEELVEFTKQWIAGSCPSASIDIRGSLIDLKDSSFDLIVVRGFFFYLDNEEILKDIFRILNPKGMAILGGGYGDRTPRELIAEIASESKILNDRLGRKWFSKDELTNILVRNNLINNSVLIDAGGLWIRISKGV